MVFLVTIKEKGTGDLVAKITTHLFVKGIGGFGVKGKVKNDFPKPPARSPDAISE